MKLKRSILIGGVLFASLFPRVVHADTPVVALNPCPDGKMIMSIGETVELSPFVPFDSDVYDPIEWQIAGTGIIQSKNDLISYNGKNSLELQALAKGTDTVTYVFDFYNYSSDQFASPVTVSSVCKVSVIDTNLKNLTLSTGSIDFDSSKTEYNLEVENTVDSIEISATLSDEANTEFIEGYGPRKVELKVGENKILVSTKDKTTGYRMDYTLNIVRKEKISLDKLIEKLKESETAKIYYENSEQYKLDIDKVSTGIKISAINLKTNKIGTTNFKYEDGILSLVPAIIEVTPDDSLEEQLGTVLFDALWTSEVLNAVASLQDLPSNKMKGWLKSLNIESPEDCTLETVGFELTMADDTEEANSLIKSFKIDLANGLKIDPNKIDEYEVEEDSTIIPEIPSIDEENSDNSEKVENENKDEVDNPSTGDASIFASIAFILTVFGLAGLSVYKIRKN